MIEGDNFRVNAPKEHISAVMACGRFCPDNAIEDTVIVGFEEEGTSTKIGNCQVELTCDGPSKRGFSLLRKPSNCGAAVVAKCYDDQPHLVATLHRDPFGTSVGVSGQSASSPSQY